MDNHSLEELTDNIVERLSTLGLHLEGNPSFHASISKDPSFDENDEDDDDDEGEEAFVMDDLIDKLKDESAHAVVHLTFTVNKLAWSDRTLHPENVIEDVTGLADILPSQKKLIQQEIARRLRAGEELSDMLDLFSLDNNKDGDSDEI